MSPVYDRMLFNNRDWWWMKTFWVVWNKMQHKLRPETQFTDLLLSQWNAI